MKQELLKLIEQMNEKEIQRLLGFATGILFDKELKSELK